MTSLKTGKLGELRPCLASLATIAVVALLSLPPAAAGAAPVAVAGRVVNGTASAPIPRDLTVTAAQVTSSGAETQRLTATTGQDGSFRFEGFSGEGSHFVVATTYLGVTYSTVKDADGSAELKAELKVFETTTDRSVIRVISDSITLIQGDEDIFEVLQLQRFVNGSDRTYVGEMKDDAGGVIELPVAVGGFEVGAGEGITPNRVRPSSVGIIANDPLQPGTTDVSYSYKLRVPRTGLALARPTAYPTDHVDVLLGPGLKLDAPGLNFVESKRFGDKDFSRYRTGPVDPGAIIEADVTHSAAATSSLWIGLASIFTFLTAIVLWGAQRHRRKRFAQPEATPVLRQSLIEEIARLDEAYSRGEVPEETYRSRRKELKDELVLQTEQLVR